MWLNLFPRIFKIPLTMGSSLSFCFHTVLLVCRNAPGFHTWTMYLWTSLNCSALTGGWQDSVVRGRFGFILCSYESFACLVAVARDWCLETRQNLVLGKLGIGTGEMGTRSTVWLYSWLLSLRWVSLTWNQRSQHHKSLNLFSDAEGLEVRIFQILEFLES